MNSQLKKSLTTLLKNTYDTHEKSIKKTLPEKQFRKIKKLANNPELFVKDMVAKRGEQVRKYIPIKYSGHFQYTVVSAVYNVEKYLDEYFESLVNQSLDFKKHIHLILVDDGSTDNSAEIIKKWQKQFPNNITYLYKENGGIASARNMGLQAVKTEWVTFIDSDDKVHLDYFRMIDKVLAEQSNIGLAVGNLHFYFEENQSIQDTHSLNYRFNKNLNIMPIKDLGKNINLFVTVSFFKTDILHKNNIIFDDKIKPNFEDGKFLADYFLYNDTQNVAYVKDAIFYYRKRGDGSSTIDGSWLKREKYLNIANHGYLPMLEQYKQKYGKIPKNIQWTVIYEIGWHIKTLINNDYKVDILTDDEKALYYQQIKQVMSYIDDQEILDFNLIGLWYLYKVGMFGLKDKKPPFNIAYVENVDREKQQILVVYQQCFDTLCSFCLDDIDVLPKYRKIVNYSFAEQTLVHEIRAWIPYENIEQKLSVDLDGQRARLSVLGRQHPQWSIKHILEKFEPSEQYTTDDSWLIMDRDTQADDNAEHFYRYMMQNHPEQMCYFALNKDSHDYERLKQEGFKMLDFGSPTFEYQLRKSSKIISSFFDDYITNYFKDEYEFSKKVVFLQHGVIMNDLSRWLNYKRNILCFITTTQPEYHAIADDYTFYHFGKKEMVLAGLPRHDNLFTNNQLDSKVILIMPTWRANAIGKSTQTGNERLFNPDFMQTEYATHWHSILHSSQLKELVKQYDYQIIFAPHANIQPYLHLLNVPQYIQIWKNEPNSGSIQQLFQQSKLMITDYSSVHFEMAVLNKTVLYYQFDKQDFFSGAHTIQKGYFDYEQHGFGAVVETETELLKTLEQVLQNNGEPVEPYATRIRETFPFRDGKCCERVYQAILDLDTPDDNHVDIDILTDFIHQAKIHENWELLEQRLNTLFALANDDINISISDYQDDYLLALFNQNKIFNILYFLVDNNLQNTDSWLEKINDIINNINPNIQEFIEQNKYDVNHTMEKIIHFLKQHSQKNTYNLTIYLIRFLAEQKLWQQLNEIFANNSTLQKELPYEYVLSQVRMGKYEGLDKVLPKPVYGNTHEYWQLAFDVATLNDNIKLQKYCRKGMLAIFSHILNNQSNRGANGE